MNLAKIILLFILLMLILIPVRAVNAQLDPFLQVTPSAAISPTVTSFFATIPVRPSATVTSFPTHTPYVVTVIHTKIITVVASTSTPEATATATITPTNTAVPTQNDSNEKETGPQSPLTIAIIGMVSTFIAGIVIGILWSKLTKR